MKTCIKILSLVLLFFTTQIALAAQSTWVDHRIQAFLNKLNSSGGKPMEQMSPQEARQVPSVRSALLQVAAELKQHLQS